MSKGDLERELRTKDELDRILLNDGLLKGIEEAPDIPAIRKQTFQNFERMRSEIEEDITKMMDDMSTFYIGDQKESYIRSRQKMDKIALSSVVFQMKAAEYTLIKALEEMDSGNLSPRFLEALSTIQDKLLGMPKAYADYLNNLEKNYEGLKIKIDKRTEIVQDDKETLIDTVKKNPLVREKVRGNFELMKSLQEKMKGEKDQFYTSNPPEEVEEVNTLIDPSKKTDIAPEAYKELTVEDKKEEIDEDLF
jgi:hypothetical protein